MICLKYGKIGRMANKRKHLKINNPKVQKKISQATFVQLKHLYISQSINTRKSNSNHKSLPILNQIKC